MHINTVLAMKPFAKERTLGIIGYYQNGNHIALDITLKKENSTTSRT